jgi:hypothetical protein
LFRRDTDDDVPPAAHYDEPIGSEPVGEFEGGAPPRQMDDDVRVALGFRALTGNQCNSRQQSSGISSGQMG